MDSAPPGSSAPVPIVVWDDSDTASPASIATGTGGYSSPESAATATATATGEVVPARTLSVARLTDGHHIPIIGFGTGSYWYGHKDILEHCYRYGCNREHLGCFCFNKTYSRLDNPVVDGNLVEMVYHALQKGLVHIDTSDSWHTEISVGIAIKKSRVSRDKIYVTTKVTNGWAGIPAAMKASLKRLQLDYVDMYLLHDPYRIESGTTADIKQAWKAMEQLKADGYTRSIGVSRFQREHIEAILEECTSPPVLNQLEYHPHLQRPPPPPPPASPKASSRNATSSLDKTSPDEISTEGPPLGYLDWMRRKGIYPAVFKTLAPITVKDIRSQRFVDVLSRIAAKYGTKDRSVVLLA